MNIKKTIPLSTLPSLKQWFLREQRAFPWRDNPSPYAVWVSEVMLQQTQASVVIPYFERWMHRFPTVKALAEAPLEDVIKLWEGLGYYSRARSLHQGAQLIMREYAGRIPSGEEELGKIKGLGPYTIGAIRSFAFHEKAAAVDGNVIRVLSRLMDLDEDVSKVKTQQKLRQIVTELLPDEEPWVISEALIELGATICTKKPHCFQCPLMNHCQAFVRGTTDQRPIKPSQAPITPLFRGVFLISAGEHWLVRQECDKRIMHGLFEFPYIEHATESVLWIEKMQVFAKEQWNAQLQYTGDLGIEKHSFTRYQVKLYAHLWEVEHPFVPPEEGYQWRSIKELYELPFSSGHRRLLRRLYRP